MVHVRFLSFLAGIFLVGSKKIGMGNGMVRTGFAKILPKGDNQKKYVDCLKNDKISIVAGIGPAGCGKTLFACHSGVSSLMTGQYDKLVITRPLVSADEDLGFLPGTMSQKMDPWVRPIFDALEEFYSASQVRDMMQSGVIEISPLSYMRGRTFKRSFIIADEMQNSTPNQMLMMLTRIGEGSKLAVTGDLMQSDLKHGTLNGLADFVKRFKMYSGCSFDGPIRMIEMDAADVLRSEAVAKILDIYNGNYLAPLCIDEGEGDKKGFDEISTESTVEECQKSIDMTDTVIRDDDAALIPKKHYTPRFEW
jgi:phosphate starvation-inducible PhoH-like protein